MVNILYFARLREALGLERENFMLPAGVDTVAKLTTYLQQRGDHWRILDLSGPTRCAVNQEVATAATPIRDGDEIAFFPPVTGG